MKESGEEEDMSLTVTMKHQKVFPLIQDSRLCVEHTLAMLKRNHKALDEGSDCARILNDTNP